MLSGKRIILGVTGGIAAYKAVYLLRDFQKAGAEVRVTMTPAATKFVGVETFASLSGHEVAVDIFPDSVSEDAWTRHIEWGEWADLFVIAPCTANTLAKIAGGFSDNMLTSTVLAARCPILISPTMDGEMYEAPSVETNLEIIKEYGYHVIEPDSGYLASGLTGRGRLPESDEILNTVADILGQGNYPLSGKKVIVTAGATREFIDPVRFISNPSSGKMGVAMAKAASRLGADVKLIHGNISIPTPKHIETEAIVSASDLFEAIQREQDADIVIMAAAVSDFTPMQKHEHKVKKSADSSQLELEKTHDILEWLGKNKRDGQILIGFAMETQNLIENAKSKLEKKNADFIVANSLSKEGAGFEVDTNFVHLISSEGIEEFACTKENVAFNLLSYIFEAE